MQGLPTYPAYFYGRRPKGGMLYDPVRALCWARVSGVSSSDLCRGRGPFKPSKNARPWAAFLTIKRAAVGDAALVPINRMTDPL